ncbi:MAG: hypothetical protein U5L00_15670 [Desulfovermiculus sp.]|nr:hypothetical protein [Desulfovermiculus sp.]
MSSRSPNEDNELNALDVMIAEITVDAYGDDEQLWAFHQAIEDNVALPADGFVIGEPVSVISVDYDDNYRRGLTARCRLLGSDRIITLRTSSLWDLVPGSIATISNMPVSGQQREKA